MPRSILVVDDERAIAIALSVALDEEEYEARTAFDGLDALRLMRQQLPDLLISDVRVPGMDGLSLARRFRQLNPSAPVILMSANYAGVDVPDTRFVRKPFDLEEMLDLVRRALGTDPPRRRARLLVRPSPVPGRAGANSD